MLDVADGAMVHFSRSSDLSVDPPVHDRHGSWLRLQRNIMELLKDLPVEQ